MSLRLRLVLAFFLLSVVPLAAVTFYSYTTNVTSLREAAEREADLLAGELGQRMQLVTQQLSERVGHLMDIAELQAAAEEVAAEPSEQSAAVTAQMTEAALKDSIAKSLGEAAMLLNNVQLRGPRGGGAGRGRGGPPPGASAADPSGRSRGATPALPPINGPVVLEIRAGPGIPVVRVGVRAARRRPLRQRPRLCRRLRHR